MTDNETPTRRMSEDEQLVEQLCRDLNAAHDEILRLQGCKEDEMHRLDWPEWSAPANSLRWAEKRLGKPLSKTSLYALARTEAKEND